MNTAHVGFATVAAINFILLLLVDVYVPLFKNYGNLPHKLADVRWFRWLLRSGHFLIAGGAITLLLIW